MVLSRVGAPQDSASSAWDFHSFHLSDMSLECVVPLTPFSEMSLSVCFPPRIQLKELEGLSSQLSPYQVSSRLTVPVVALFPLNSFFGLHSKVFAISTRTNKPLTSDTHGIIRGPLLNSRLSPDATVTASEARGLSCNPFAKDFVPDTAFPTSAGITFLPVTSGHRSRETLQATDLLSSFSSRFQSWFLSTFSCFPFIFLACIVAKRWKAYLGMVAKLNIL